LPQCQPCAGVRFDSAEDALRALDTLEPLSSNALFYVAWPVTDSGKSVSDLANSLRELGAVAWPTVTFLTLAPLVDNLTELEIELQRLATVAGSVGEGAYLQIDWRPGGSRATREQVSDLAFLIKRAAVTITGVNTSAHLIVGPLWPDAGHLRALYLEDVAAYVDGMAILPAPEDQIAAFKRAFDKLDPGRPLVLDGPDMPHPCIESLALVADAAEQQSSVTLLRAAADVDLAPLHLLAEHFSGDVSLDPYSVPSGGEEAWSFVRGDDFSIQVIVRVAPGTDELTLEFAEAQLRKPERIMADGQTIPLLGGRRTSKGMQLSIADPDPVTVVKLQRLTAAEIEGIQGLDEVLTVESARTMPVGEILRRLQAFEDAQARRIDRYSATNTLSLRMQGTGGTQSVDLTFRGDLFFNNDGTYDWAWQEFFVNGVRWRSKRVPQIPLLQPEKASALPAEITFTKDYRYRLRGTEVVDGRDCWVVDFEPSSSVKEGQSLYQGTVWVDRDIYVRVKSRTQQLGLRGEVVSNDETIFFHPLDAEGQPAAWSPESFFLPTHTIGQQVFSLLAAAVVVEREVTLSAVRINPDDFDSRRQAVLSTDVTMVRDTEVGLRYLVPDKETGGRVVQEELDATRLFLLGGVFYDEAQDFPIPLAGVNWLSFDLKGKGVQANVFFAGVLVLADIATPSLFGSRWEAGADFFVLGLAGTDTLYVDAREDPTQDVETLRPNLDLTIGRNIGTYFKVDLEYSIGWNRFSKADDTADDFTLPTDHLDHRFRLVARYNRSGYRLRLGGGYGLRDQWEAWGPVDNSDFDPKKNDYVTWGGGIAKIWHLPHFFKIGAEIEYVDGDDLDRFSKYGFGPFSDIRVRGYRSGLVRAEQAWATHLSYGFNLGEIFQLNLLADAAWASDIATGLDNELLVGLGIAGTFIAPWSTLINIDIGKAVAGPDDGFTAFIAILKLFK